MLQYERIDISERIDVNKSDESKERVYDFAIIGILKKLIISMNHIFVINVMIY